MDERRAVQRHRVPKAGKIQFGVSTMIAQSAI
jgi:hypothetical protein